MPQRPQHKEAGTDDDGRADRLITFTDAVVAIAMTLLALDLKPDLPSSASSSELAHYLGRHAGQYGAFVLAFALIAQYWMSHHRLMRTVHQASDALLRSTLLFLFGIIVIPLTTYINGQFGNHLAATLFAANLLLVSLSLGLTGEVIHRGQLDDAPEQAADRVTRRARSVFTVLVPAAVGGLVWVIGSNADWLYLLFFVSDYPAKLLRRHRERS